MSGAIPNPHEWRLLSDVDYDAFRGSVDVEVMYLQSTAMFRCPTSDHLWFFWDGMGEPPRLYGPEKLPPGWE